MDANVSTSGRRQALGGRQVPELWQLTLSTFAASQMMKLAHHRAAPSTGGMRRERQVGFAMMPLAALVYSDRWPCAMT